MKILEIRINNIGRHKRLHNKFNAAVVGLLGPNGCGKSTVLSVLKYLFTGLLDQPQETYIRNGGAKEEIKYGEGYAKFEQNGMVGEIYRRVGSPAQRWLVWEGVKYTKAADIESKLTEIFGADKYAMSQIFVAQGDLDKFLFGKQSDREDMFVKLLLLGHINKVADAIAIKLQTLNKELTDFTLVTDELQAQKNALEIALADIETELTTREDLSSVISVLSSLQFISEDVRKLNNEQRGIEADILRKENAFKDWLSSNTKWEDFSEDPAWARNMSSSVETLGREVADIEHMLKVQSRLNNTKQRILKLEASNELARTARSTIPSDIVDRYNAACSMLASVREYEDRVVKAQQAAKDLETARQEHLITQHQLTQIPDSSCSLAEEKLQKSIREAEKTHLRYSVLKHVHDGHSSTCPVCDSSNINQEDVPARLAAAEAAANRAADELARAKVISSKLANTREAYRRAYDMATSNLADKAKNFAESNPGEPPCDKNSDELQKDLDNIKVSIERYDSLTIDIKSRDAAIEELRTTQLELEAELSSYQHEVSEELFRRKLDELLACKSELQLYNSLLEKINEHDSDIKDLRIKHSESKSRVASQLKEFDSLYAELPHHILVNLNKSGIDNTKAHAEEQQKERQAKLGEKVQLQKQADELLQRVTDLENAKDRDREKQKLIDELRRLKEAFSRGGITTLLMRDRFAQLSELAQRNLEIMNANFVVYPDEHKLVTLNFVRTDDDTGAVFSQEKLSGGQRVYLTIAFLLAIQQLVVPELSFLLLDEPSLHLDPEAKSSLADLLGNLNAQLDNAEAQVIVSDHAPELESAFGDIIRLT